MLSIKEYAQRCGKSEQAVYKQIKSQKNRDRLKGHIVRREGKQWLDEEAVRILDESRIQSPVIVVEDNQADRIRELEAEQEQYKAKILELQEAIIKNQNQIIQLQMDQKSLPDLERELDNHKTLLLEKTQQYEAEKQRADLMQKSFQLKADQVEMLAKELAEEKERRLTFKERIFGKKEK